MKKLNLAILLGLFVATGNVMAADEQSACDIKKMSEQQFNDCIVVEGNGETWASYQQELQELDRLVKEQRNASKGVASR